MKVDETQFMRIFILELDKCGYSEQTIATWVAQLKIVLYELTHTTNEDP